ncbi:MAG: protein kinase domain-containing protein [Acidobacteriota bacterium]
MTDVQRRLSAVLARRYRIERELGAGGMATVYLADDLKHQRKVALKVLRPELAALVGAERFFTEIRVTANLQHPNILPLYDSGEADSLLYYVMPFVEGESLRQRLRRERQLTVEDTLAIAGAVAAALEYAHEQGIIHRDIKPENILLARGRPMVADFGIALAMSDAGATRMTHTGLSVGTPHYMSPEQAAGDRQLDARSDVYSLGATVYEMLVGEPPHAAATAQAIVAKILSDTPAPISRSRQFVPPHVEAAVQKALAKSPADRFSSAGRFAEALSNPAFRLPDSPAAARNALAASRRIALLTLGLVVAAGLALWGWLRPAGAPAPGGPPAPSLHASIVLPMSAQLSDRFTGANLAISADGARLVYAGVQGNQSQLYLRSLDRVEVEPVAGTSGAQSPFFSPDGDWIGFFADGKLKRVPVAGGPALTVCDASFGLGGVWGDDGAIVFSGGLMSGLSRVAVEGGTAEPFTTLNAGEGSHRWPALVPGSRDVLFAVGSGINWNEARIAVQSLDERQHLVLSDFGTSPRYSPTGHLLFARTGSLLAVPYDRARRATTGPPIPLSRELSMTTLGGNAHYALSANGTLVYIPGAVQEARGSLVWVDWAGVATPLPTPVRGFEIPRISPDGTRIALTIREGDSDVWIVETARGALTRMTHEAGEDHSVAWSPDGQRIAYSSTRAGQSLMMVMRADGSGSAEQLLVSEEHAHLGGWTPDGDTLLLDGATPSSRHDLYAVTIGESGSRRPYRVTPFNEQNARPSPDGRWTVYSSDESGQDEIYVEAFPGPGGRTQVSSGGGGEPVWARNGREIFYRSGNRMMVVAVEPGPPFKTGVPRVLFEGEFASVVWRETNYDVSPDGRRFLMIKGDAQPPASELRLIVNWVAEMRRDSQ